MGAGDLFSFGDCADADGEGAVAAQRIVDLHETGFQPRLGEFALAEQAGEKTTLVLALVELDDIGAGEPAAQLGQEMEWVSREQLATLEFPPADAELIRILGAV